MKGDLRYTPSDCFETFAFPESMVGLTTAGERYYKHRQQLMQDRQEGLTTVYTRFHNQANDDADISELRQLQIEMDHAVAESYDWKDLDLGHGFHPTKQGVRFTLAEEARRNVLDRLLKLNHERYAAEHAAGKHEKAKKPKKSPKKVTAQVPLDLALDNQ